MIVGYMDESEFTFFSIGRICAALREDGIFPKFIELLMILVIAGNTAYLQPMELDYGHRLFLVNLRVSSVFHL